MTANQTKILKNALLDFALSEADYFEALDEKVPCYSDAFKSKIAELSQRKSKRHPTSKRVAFILIAAAITVLLIASASAIVVGFGGYLVNVYEKYIEIKFNNDNDEKTAIEKIYAPSYIPNGYSKTSNFNYSTSYSSAWSNGECSIVLNQNAYNKTYLTSDNESNEYQSFELDGKTVYYYTKHNTVIFTWISEEYVFSINCSDDIPLDEIKLMISSMEPTDK